MPRELAQKRNVRAHLADAARQSGAPLLVEGRSRGRLLRALVERRVVGVEPGIAAKRFGISTLSAS